MQHLKTMAARFVLNFEFIFSHFNRLAFIDLLYIVVIKNINQKNKRSKFEPKVDMKITCSKFTDVFFLIKCQPKKICFRYMLLGVGPIRPIVS